MRRDEEMRLLCAQFSEVRASLRSQEWLPYACATRGLRLPRREASDLVVRTEGESEVDQSQAGGG
jgi:hypothetical protein